VLVGALERAGISEFESFSRPEDRESARGGMETSHRTVGVRNRA